MTNDWLKARAEQALPIYKTWHAINLHFHIPGTYDYFKYNGATNIKFETFAKSDNAKKAMNLIKPTENLNLERVFFSVLRDEKVWIGTPWSRMSVKYLEWERLYGTEPNFINVTEVLPRFLDKSITLDEAAISAMTLPLIPNNMFEEVACKKINKLVPFYKKFYGDN